MESTGVFWIPVWNVLEQCETKFALTLINPQHVHALPGHKTDRKDGQRIAELLQYGLLKNCTRISVLVAVTARFPSRFRFGVPRASSEERQ